MNVEQINDIIPDKERRYEILKTIAANDSPATFQKMLNKFEEDEESLEGLLAGFHDAVVVKYGTIQCGNTDDQVDKREILRAFVARHQKKSSGNLTP